MNVMLCEPGIHTAVTTHPAACEEFWWGKRLAAVHVDLAVADLALAGELLDDAWEQKAPSRLGAGALAAVPSTDLGVGVGLEVIHRFGLLRRQLAARGVDVAPARQPDGHRDVAGFQR